MREELPFIFDLLENDMLTSRTQNLFGIFVINYVNLQDWVLFNFYQKIHLPYKALITIAKIKEIEKLLRKAFPTPLKGLTLIASVEKGLGISLFKQSIVARQSSTNR